MDRFKFEYIRKRRKRFLAAFFALIVFGTVLFMLSSNIEFGKEDDAVEAVEGGVTELYRKMVSEEMESEEYVSRNILPEPVSVNYRIEGNRLSVHSKIKLRGNFIEEPFFEIKEHGNMIFSERFFSKNGNIHCKGVMEKGAAQFFIYYCSMN